MHNRKLTLKTLARFYLLAKLVESAANGAVGFVEQIEAYSINKVGESSVVE
jgi:hypothetical protein